MNSLVRFRTETPNTCQNFYPRKLSTPIPFSDRYQKCMDMINERVDYYSDRLSTADEKYSRRIRVKNKLNTMSYMETEIDLPMVKEKSKLSAMNLEKLSDNQNYS